MISKELILKIFKFIFIEIKDLFLYVFRLYINSQTRTPVEEENRFENGDGTAISIMSNGETHVVPGHDDEDDYY